MNSNKNQKKNQTKFTRVRNYNKKTGEFIWKKAFREAYSDFELGAKWNNIDKAIEYNRSVQIGYQASTDQDIWAKESKSGKSIRFYLKGTCHTISMKGFYKPIEDYRSQFVGIYRINPDPIPAKKESKMIVNPQLSNPPPGQPIPLFVPQEEIIAVELPEEKTTAQKLRDKLAQMSDEELSNLFKPKED